MEHRRIMLVEAEVDHIHMVVERVVMVVVVMVVTISKMHLKRVA